MTRTGGTGREHCRHALRPTLEVSDRVHRRYTHRWQVFGLADATRHRPAYRCGAAPDFHRIPLLPRNDQHLVVLTVPNHQ